MIICHWPAVLQKQNAGYCQCRIEYCSSTLPSQSSTLPLPLLATRKSTARYCLMCSGVPDMLLQRQAPAPAAAAGKQDCDMCSLSTISHLQHVETQFGARPKRPVLRAVPNENSCASAGQPSILICYNTPSSSCLRARSNLSNFRRSPVQDLPVELGLRSCFLAR